MKWPQITMIIIFGANAGIALIKNGERKNDKYDFVTTVIAIAVEAIILGAGGFWKTL